MVSLHTPLSPTRTKMMMIPDFENSSKKRKWEEESQAEEAIHTQPSKTKNTKYMFDTELHLETPLPLEWQRCLDIEVRQLYSYTPSSSNHILNDNGWLRIVVYISNAVGANILLQYKDSYEDTKGSKENNPMATKPWSHEPGPRAEPTMWISR